MTHRPKSVLAPNRPDLHFFPVSNFHAPAAIAVP
ncbi:hypothetical protein CFU_2086 [Collimonas fungivorans Ter331]|uniref:Uncharacterized protein n=1 Tax=Collimonas fungivorans (strain Ter331) TaxID=1005048 RepID=G0ABW0_COLFT|nr:hypothetical protein CFU_2086 [Collimonas fungivorans Ter331]